MAGTITQENLLKAMKSKNPPFIVDVRSGPEYRSAHIEGAVNIPFFSVLRHRDQLPADKHKTLVLTCEHGPRASIANLFLRLTGYRYVFYLEGHMSGWKKNNRPTV